MYRRDFLALATALLLLPGCSDPIPQLPRLAADAPLLAFGDSLTYGTGAAVDDAYPAILATLANRTVINAGVPGETSEGGLDRLAALLDEHRPSLLLLCHGGNDLLRKLDSETTRANLRQMVQSAQARGIPVLFVGVPKPALFSLDAAPVYDELAAELGLLYEREIIPLVLSDNALKSDQVHPNAEGYRRIAARLHQLLVAAGAL